jgi:hypothetical protein
VIVLYAIDECIWIRKQKIVFFLKFKTNPGEVVNALTSMLLISLQ